MSNQVQTWVFMHSETTGNDRLVLLALADEANDDGTNAYPSIERLARKARVNRATALRAIRRLEEDKEILVERPERHGRGRHNTYIVLMGRDPENVADCDLSSAPQKGAETLHKGAERRAQARPDPKTLRPDDPKAESKALASPNGDSTKRASSLPEQFFITEAMRVWASEHTPTVDLRSETAQFCDYHRAKGDRMKDWVAAWRTWMRNAVRFQRNGRNGTAPSAARAKEQRTADAMRNVFGDDAEPKPLRLMP